MKPTAGRRSGISPVYEFVLAAEVPEEDTFVQVRGEPQQRGRVTRTADRSVTVRFDQPVDWDRIPRQGRLEETFSRVVYEKQREAVDHHGCHPASPVRPETPVGPLPDGEPVGITPAHMITLSTGGARRPMTDGTGRPGRAVVR